MELTTAVRLIKDGVEATTAQRWIDLGAGDGFFTKALASLLKKGSSIVAIDKKSIKISGGPDVQIESMAGDFTTLDFEESDGVIMANALHYVANQKQFLKNLESKTDRLVLVEYNTDKGNQWVPHPISFNTLRSLYPNARLIGEETSMYHKEGMYAALILF